MINKSNSEIFEMRNVLFNNSKRYFNTLKGPNGRFRQLYISDIILAGISTNIIDTDVKINNCTENSLNKTIEILWYENIRHAFVVGEGGMGKTVSLLRLWEEYLNNDSDILPIYIALNEYNNIESNSRNNFIINTISMAYLGKKYLIQQEENKLWDLFRSSNKEKPSVILLLDGFNEITNDKSDLLIELNNLIKYGDELQIIITSRLDVRDALNLNQFNILTLIGLKNKQIFDYCNIYNIPVPVEKLLETVKNPMMLTIYSLTCNIIMLNRKNKYYDFKEKAQSSGELLWNFIEVLTFKHAETDEKGYYYKFLLKHLLPFIGWKMELEGKFFLSFWSAII